MTSHHITHTTTDLDIAHGITSCHRHRNRSLLHQTHASRHHTSHAASVWQAQYTESPEGAAAHGVAAGARSCLLAGATPTAFRSGCRKLRLACTTLGKHSLALAAAGTSKVKLHGFQRSTKQSEWKPKLFIHEPRLRKPGNRISIAAPKSGRTLREEQTGSWCTSLLVSYWFSEGELGPC